MAVAYPDAYLCGQWQNFTTPELTFFQNAWGQDGSGGSCLNVTNNGKSFASTWMWANDSNTHLVHAYPNVNLNSIQQAPVHISSISSLDVDVEWAMHPSVLTTSSAFEASALQGVDAIADVAFDLFIDPIQKNSNSTTTPSYEIMFWLGTIGNVLPIGADFNSALARPTCNVGNTTFSMYNGSNNAGQYVFSWLANGNTTKFTGDLMPCVRYLMDHDFLPASTFLGVVQFGTETFHAKEYVTFSANNVQINVTMYGDAKKNAGVSDGSNGWGFAALAALVALSVVLQG